MPFMCLWSPAWRDESTIAIQAQLLNVVPRISTAHELVWVDVRGLPSRKAAEDVKAIVGSASNLRICIGIADTPIAAEVAARYSQNVFTRVSTGDDRKFLASFPISVLHPDPVTESLMDGAGVELCGELAGLNREAVEVRFGSSGVKIWQLSRAHDPRRIFSPITLSLPESGYDWTDYTIKRAERLIFIINALCGNVCESLESQGMGAISMLLKFSLNNRTSYEHVVRAARATSNRTVWMRLLRAAIEKIQLADGVTGIVLQAHSVAGLASKQGDLFDVGFTTAKAAEDAVGQIMDDMGDVVFSPENTNHPLVDSRTTWNVLSPGNMEYEKRFVNKSKASDRVLNHVNESALVVGNSKNSGEAADVHNHSLALTLQLFQAPVRISVNTEHKYGRLMPSSYWNAGRQHIVIDAAGPDIIDGGWWGDRYSREYYRCVNDMGVLVWIYRDVRSETWYLQGWWD